ncbi:hypothetical protein BC834DRAFT_890505 [Gloeopeniophorella convolvens]|nr:hypothetical protein BC834DRAFT_890505 [Gloeopeniophorella convolvens]
MFYDTTALGQPEKIVTMKDTEAFDIAWAILGLMNRSLTSDLISESTRRRRSALCLKVLKLDSSVFEGFTFAAHQSVGFKWVEFGLVAEQHQHGRNDSSHQVAFTIALITKNVRAADERWFPTMIRQLSVSASDLQGLLSRGDDLLLTNLIRLTQRIISAWDTTLDGGIMERSLDALQEFDITKTSCRLQHEICSLWNQILEGLREPGCSSIRQMNTRLLLHRFRPSYIALHPEARPALTTFSALTDVWDLAAKRSSPILCAPTRITNTFPLGHTLLPYTLLSP